VSLLSQPGGIVAVFPGGAVGVYGPRGFTRRPEVADVLDPFELGDPAGDLVELSGIPVRDAALLLALLPANQADVAAPGAPSFAALLAAARGWATATFGGFRVAPRRFDERIVLDSLTLSGDDVTPARRRRLLDLAPSTLEAHDHLLVARWA
jgi:hypothetical protein